MSKPSSQIFYRQCRYESAFPEGGTTQWDESWIPEKLAKVGKLIYFSERKFGVPPEKKFRIISVGDRRRSAEWLHKNENASRHHRDVSDV